MSAPPFDVNGRTVFIAGAARGIGKATAERLHGKGATRRAAWLHRQSAPVVKAIDAIERGIERRSARLWAPRWVGPMLAARGLLQPLLERRALRDSEALANALRVAESSGEAQSQDPLLGVAAQAIE